MDKVLSFGKKIIKQKIDKNSIVVDATCGNGNDTLFLANTSCKKVFGFDIQSEAINNTNQLLKNKGVYEKCQIIKDTHTNIDNYINDKITCAMFNLGYLPGANHDVTTLGEETVKAIKKSLRLLKVNGIISIVVYWGHSKGKIEKEILLEFLSTLNQKYVEVLEYKFINQKNNPPFLILLEKIKEFDEVFNV